MTPGLRLMWGSTCCAVVGFFLLSQGRVVHSQPVSPAAPGLGGRGSASPAGKGSLKHLGSGKWPVLAPLQPFSSQRCLFGSGTEVPPSSAPPGCLHPEHPSPQGLVTPSAPSRPQRVPPARSTDTHVPSTPCSCGFGPLEPLWSPILGAELWVSHLNPLSRWLFPASSLGWVQATPDAAQGEESFINHIKTEDRSIHLKHQGKGEPLQPNVRSPGGCQGLICKAKRKIRAKWMRRENLEQGTNPTIT